MLALGNERVAKMMFNRAIMLDRSFRPKVDEVLRNYHGGKQ